MAQLKLPIGIENFKKIRTEGYYYVDKTDVIRQILEDGCFVTLFTRPRRFGKFIEYEHASTFFLENSVQTVRCFQVFLLLKIHELCQKFIWESFLWYRSA